MCSNLLLDHISRSGSKLKYTLRKTGTDFLANRVVNYWNKLPDYVKSAESVTSFKIRLENHKSQSDATGNFWELSDEVFSRISNDSHDAYVTFMIANPQIAKRRGINIVVED